jgi:hypothetical protein
VRCRSRDSSDGDGSRGSARARRRPRVFDAYAAKAPVMLPARGRATLAIAPEAVGTAGLSDQRGGYVSTVRFLACREREPARGYRGTVGKYTGFPFAFAAKERSACIPMEVWLVGELTPIGLIVPFGRSSC